MKKRIVIGIVAHVDAGKTTLAESMLYHSGRTRHLGRVDNGDAYLDTHGLERLRGITIFAKQAVFPLGDVEITLLDTPGHVDFSAETERALQVLDCALLVVSGADGIQGHTKTLWRLLRLHGIPTFIFINKMDQAGADPSALLHELKTALSDLCIPLNDPIGPLDYEQLALCDEEAMELYLAQGTLPESEIRRLIALQRVFPVYFGSALRQIGVDVLMKGLSVYLTVPNHPEPFGARVFKISRDALGNRLTHMKITGGQLRVKDPIKTEAGEEKVNQIRVYSGERYDTPAILEAGAVCAVTGLTQTRPGQGLGAETDADAPTLEPVLAYTLILPENVDALMMLPKLRQLEEEEPTLRLVWHEARQEILVQMMGDVQLEILQALILERFDTTVAFGEGRIIYKETITAPCEGVGHFEPLGHYAEVHLLLEPAPRGSGLTFSTACSEDLLDRSWQRQILACLKERPPVGVLTGSPVTDLRVTLMSGLAHNRHTDGGDFREAAGRALRQGLKHAESVLLEPYYAYRLELPTTLVGKAMAAIDQMHGTCELSESLGDQAVLTGKAPVSAMQHYHREVMSFTRGHGRLATTPMGYEICHDAEAVIRQMAYDSERDVEHPTGSIFCRQGAGFYVPWDQVKDHMHLQSSFRLEAARTEEDGNAPHRRQESGWISLEEIDQIINSTYYANQGRKSAWKKQKSSRSSYYEGLSSAAPSPPRPAGEEYLLIDGYNIIFAWPELKALAADDLEAARLRLQDILCNYNGIRNIRIIVVFDAYRVEGRREQQEEYHNISLVFTAEAQTADQYIEKFARAHQGQLRVTVATSDALQQVIIRGSGSQLLSARELQEEVVRVLSQLEDEHLAQRPQTKAMLQDALSEEEKALLKDKSRPDETP